MPRTPCERLLDLCSGSGIAALAAARSAGQAWAVDITERSTRFAEFNARLNAIENVMVVQGDLYQPVAGLTFDRILAHPPYVPAAGPPVIFRDGGEDGEEVLRAVLAGLPDHLRVGGCFYATAMATDRAGAPLEASLRSFLGARASEFDLVLAVHHELHPSEWNLRQAMSDMIPFSLVEERHHLFRRLDAQQCVYSSMLVRRHGGARPPISLRRQAAEGAGEAEAARLLRWATGGIETDLASAILDAAPRLSPHARLHVDQPARGGGVAARLVPARDRPAVPERPRGLLRRGHAPAPLRRIRDRARAAREAARGGLDPARAPGRGVRRVRRGDGGGGGAGGGGGTAASAEP